MSVALIVALGQMFVIYHFGRGVGYASFIGNVKWAIATFILATPVAWRFEVKRHLDARNRPKPLNLD